jgi:hypothetical protein
MFHHCLMLTQKLIIKIKRRDKLCRVSEIDGF